MYIGKGDVLDFSDKIIYFIEVNGLQNNYGNLIIDYIESLYLNGYPVLQSDIEKQVYDFYNYINLFENIIIHHGEDEFIKYIVMLKLTKNKL